MNNRTERRQDLRSKRRAVTKRITDETHRALYVANGLVFNRATRRALQYSKTPGQR